MNTRTIGTYELEGLLGEGGIGQVYAGQDKVIGRRVAIKMLRPELSRDKNFVDRFHVEAKSLGNLNHSNITTLYALHTEGEEAFMVMELVLGNTLEALLARVQRLTLRDSLAILAQTIAGMRYAHRRGVIHRDLKPANLMVTDDGVVKIMDFGIARVQGSQHLTRVGEFCGTFVYASPEQIKGEEVDERSDLYSLAIVFYRMLAGTAPFTSDNEYALMTAQLQAPPPPLAGRVPDLDAATEAVLMRALAKRPDDRFASIEAFGRAIGAMALRGESVDILQQLYARVFESGDSDATRIIALKQPAEVDQTRPSNRPELRAPNSRETDSRAADWQASDWRAPEWRAPDWRGTDRELPPGPPASAPAYPEPRSNRADFQLAGTQVLPSLLGHAPADPEPWPSRRDLRTAAAGAPPSVRPATLPATRRAGPGAWLIMAGALALLAALGGLYYGFVANGPTQLASTAPLQRQAEPAPPSPPPAAEPIRTEAPPPPAPAPVETAKAEPKLAPVPVPAPVETAKTEPKLAPVPVPAPVETAKTEPKLAPVPVPAPVETAKTEPKLAPVPVPAPIEAAKTEPQLPPAPIEAAKVEPQVPPAPASPPIEVAKAEPPLPPAPNEPAKTESRSAVDRPVSGVQVATAQPQTSPEPGPSLGPPPLAAEPEPATATPPAATPPAAAPQPTAAPQPEGVPDLQGRVTGAKGFNEIEVNRTRWIKIHGIVDRARGAQEAQHTEALLRYLKPSQNHLVCYRKAGDSYRCYSDGQDIARLALRDRLVQLAPNAPAEYRSLLPQGR